MFDQRSYCVPVTLYIGSTLAIMGCDIISVARILRVALRWVTEGHKTALSCSADPLLRPGHAHRGAGAVGQPSKLTAPPLLCTLHPSQHSNLLEMGTSLSLHMHKHTPIPLVQWPLFQGCVRPMGALQTDYVECWRRCHLVGICAELDAL